MFSVLPTTHPLYQAFGIVGLIVSVLSFQVKNNKIFLMCQVVVSVLFGVQFFLGGAWAGFLVNCVNGCRSLIMAFVKNKKARLTLLIVCCLGIVGAGCVAYFIFHELLLVAILIVFASVVAAIAVYFDDKKIIRYVQLGIVSPCWMFNNIYFLSIGGIVSESLTIVSTSIALIRWKREEKKIAKEQ